MEPNIKFDRTLVAVNVDGTVHLMLELTAPPAATTDRAAIDVVVVLDRSGSMGGPPMHAVREATCNLLRLLGKNDRIGVVAFDDEVELVLPLATHDVDGACARIRQIETSGSTNLSGGWLKGFEMLSADGRVDALRRIIVLTDGHANAGITEPAALCGITAAAKEQGVTTTTVGFDDGYDEVLLAAIADAGAGNDYWCAGPDQAPQVFAAEFDGLSSVVAQNISVEIRPRVGVEVAVLNEFPITVVPGGMQVALGDAYGGERRRIVAKLSIPAQAAAGSVELAELVMRWASTVDTVSLHTVTIPVTVNASDDPNAEMTPDPEVIEEVNVLRAARAMKDAHESILRGDEGGARAALAATIDFLAPMPSQAAAVAEVRAALNELDHGQWSAASTKRLHSNMRGAAKGRRSRFEDEPG
jgi:Ca-activated chloride channel family protein